MAIDFHTTGTGGLTPEQWVDAQEVQREAYRHELAGVRSPQEIDNLVLWDNPELFVGSHIDPNKLRGIRRLPNQSYHDPIVTVALKDGELVGYGTAANNVSWSLRRRLHIPDTAFGRDLTAIDRFEAQRKLRSDKKNVLKFFPPNPSSKYFWLGEMAVLPDYQREGMGTEILLKLLSRAYHRQPVTAYIWPDEIPFLSPLLVDLGFEKTAQRDVNVFGLTKDPARQVRMEAKRASDVADELRKKRKPIS